MAENLLLCICGILELDKAEGWAVIGHGEVTTFSLIYSTYLYLDI